MDKQNRAFMPCAVAMPRIPARLRQEHKSETSLGNRVSPRLKVKQQKGLGCAPWWSPEFHLQHHKWINGVGLGSQVEGALHNRKVARAPCRGSELTCRAQPVTGPSLFIFFKYLFYYLF